MEKIIETDRLILRQPNLSDANSLFPLLSDEDIERFTPGLYCSTINDVISYINIVRRYNYYQDLCFIIELKSSQQIIGLIEGYSTSDNIFPISYACIRSARGNGYIPEAAKAFVNYIYSNCNLNAAIFSIEKTNLPSQRVMQKLKVPLVDQTQKKKKYCVSLKGDLPF